MEITEKILLDDAAGLRETPDGYLVARPRVARTGIQLYRGFEVGRPTMDTVRVYRPENEVMSTDSMHSYAHRPVTNNHPPMPVTADNWKEYSVGQIGDEVARDGDFIRVPLVLMDAGVIKAVKEGKRELSLGYTCDFKWESGALPDGQQYDAIQTNIRANHLAVVAAARGGPDLRLGDGNEGEPVMTKKMTVDGIEVEVVNDVAEGVIRRHIGNLEKSIDALKAKLGETEEETKKEKKAKDDALAQVATKDAEIATLKTQLKDAEVTPAKLDALVKDRAEVVARAQAVIGDALVVDGKTVSEIRRQVVDAKLKDAAKGWTDDQVAASFNTLTADVKTDGLQRAIGDSGSRPGFAAQPRAQDAAYNDRVKDLGEAWRGQKPN